MLLCCNYTTMTMILTYLVEYADKQQRNTAVHSQAHTKQSELSKGRFEKKLLTYAGWKVHDRSGYFNFPGKCAQMIWNRCHIIFVRLVVEVDSAYAVVCSASSCLHCQRRRRGSALATNIQG